VSGCARVRRDQGQGTGQGVPWYGSPLLNATVDISTDRVATPDKQSLPSIETGGLST
jgi:hypothetical protein